MKLPTNNKSLDKDELSIIEELNIISNDDFEKLDLLDDFDLELDSDSEDIDREELKEHLIDTDEIKKISNVRSPIELFEILKNATTYSESINKEEFESCILTNSDSFSDIDIESPFETEIDNCIYANIDFDKLAEILMFNLNLVIDQREVSKIISAIFKLKENSLKRVLTRLLNLSEKIFSNSIDNCMMCTNGMNNASRETIKHSSEIFYKLAKLTHKDLMRNLKDSIKV